ncbi:unnamed protein product [Prunus armeniaca]|uniref:Uncharacterized protein n=1 Tax=Prunus armeniaca TaxID=36596 RepID=A0A6J5UHS5_PRUAR|nr:unnamed protein product [Prunus armeniaca]
MGLWNGRPLSHWNWLCELFKDPDYQEICMANANNCKQQKYSHRRGAQLFVQHVQAKAKNGKLPSFIENWGDLHLDKNQQWISEAAQEKHARLADKAPKGTPFDSIEVPLESEFQIIPWQEG